MIALLVLKFLWESLAAQIGTCLGPKAQANLLVLMRQLNWLPQICLLWHRCSGSGSLFIGIVRISNLSIIFCNRWIIRFNQRNVGRLQFLMSINCYHSLIIFIKFSSPISSPLDQRLEVDGLKFYTFVRKVGRETEESLDVLSIHLSHSQSSARCQHSCSLRWWSSFLRFIQPNFIKMRKMVHKGIIRSKFIIMEV